MRDDSTGERRMTEAALARYDEFRRRVLPAVWRRLLIWKGFDAKRRKDLVHDIEHAILLDCLAHAAEIVAVPKADRHKRWLKVLQREFYTSCERDTRLAEHGSDLADVVGTPAPAEIGRALTGLELCDRDRAAFARLLPCVRRLKNGRLSIEATARAAGMRRQRVRELWLRLADRLERGHEWVSFRRKRLAESLCALAAASLRSAPALDPTGESRVPAPDLASRRARTIVAAIEWLPLEGGLRLALAEIRDAIRARGDRTPRQLLALAARIAPDDPRVPMWQVEAERAAGRPWQALDALRRARRLRIARSAAVVARVRVLADRGRWSAARALLARARRRGIDARLRLAADELEQRFRQERAPLRHAPSTRTLRADTTLDAHGRRTGES